LVDSNFYHTRLLNIILIVDIVMQGLGDAVEYLLPYAEHRFCVRHLHANFKAKGYKGKAFKDELWAAARASNPTVFDKHMTTIKSMDAGAYTYLSGINPASWSRHAFTHIRRVICS
jgi:hypothetical protein